MMYFSDDKQVDTIDAFNTTSRYLDDILNINNIYFDNIIKYTLQSSNLIIPIPLIPQLRFGHAFVHSNDTVSTKIYHRHDDFDFEIINFPFLNGDVPCYTSYGVYISQFIQFARLVADLYTGNKLLTQKLLKQGFRYQKLCKKNYRRYYDLISKFHVGLKSLLHQGLWEPDFYGDLVFKLKENCWHW